MSYIDGCTYRIEGVDNNRVLKLSRGDDVTFSTGERGWCVSPNGPVACPLIITYYNTRYHCDDVIMLPRNGIASERLYITDWETSKSNTTYNEMNTKDVIYTNTKE